MLSNSFEEVVVVNELELSINLDSMVPPRELDLSELLDTSVIDLYIELTSSVKLTETNNVGKAIWFVKEVKILEVSELKVSSEEEASLIVDLLSKVEVTSELVKSLELDISFVVLEISLMELKNSLVELDISLVELESSPELEVSSELEGLSGPEVSSELEGSSEPEVASKEVAASSVSILPLELDFSVESDSLIVLISTISSATYNIEMFWLIPVIDQYMYIEVLSYPWRSHRQKLYSYRKLLLSRHYHLQNSSLHPPVT